MRSLALLLLGLSALPAARADIELSGVLVAGEKTTLGLADTATEEVRWLTLGQSFAGWKLAAYDAKKETLTLTKGDATKLVKLKTAVIQESKPDVVGTFSLSVRNYHISQEISLTYGQTTVISLPHGFAFEIKFEKVEVSGSLKQPVVPVLPQASFQMRLVNLAGPDGKPEVLINPSVTYLEPDVNPVQIGGDAMMMDPHFYDVLNGDKPTYSSSEKIWPVSADPKVTPAGGYWGPSYVGYEAERQVGDALDISFTPKGYKPPKPDASAPPAPDPFAEAVSSKPAAGD